MADQDDFAAAVASSIKGWLPSAQENAAGRLGLDSAGGVQHSVGGTRVWWVDDKGDLREGRVPRVENDLGRLSLDSAGGVQHSVSGTRVFWINDQGEIAQGTVPWGRITGAPEMPTGGTLKTAVLHMTTGITPTPAATSRSVRFPLRYNAALGRFRVHIRNWNPRLGQVVAEAVNFTGLWLADTSGAGAITGTPTQLEPAFTTPADGSEWVSDWYDAEIGGDVERLLCYGYDTAVQPHGISGGSYQASGSASAISGGVFTSATAAFEVWIEAETPTTTPVIAGVGDSLTVGVGATLPVYDSWLSQYARRVGALPMHVAHAGDSLTGFVRTNSIKWRRWASYASADAVVFGLGSNDLAANRPIADMQADYETLIGFMEKEIGPIRYVSTVQPRNGWDAAKEAERGAWNDWLTSRPEIRGVLDFASVVSADGDTIRPEYNADGTHLNTAGYAAEAASITTALTAPSPSLAVDGLSERVDALEARSGIRDVTAMFSLASGVAYLEVRDGTAWLEFINAVLPGTGNVEMTVDGLLPVAPESPRTSHNLAVLEGSSSYRRLQVNLFGRALVYAYAGGALNGTASWPMTRPTPATWPGAPA